MASVLGILALAAALSLLMGIPTMYLVNYLFSIEFLVFVFGAKLTFWKAFALNLVASILLKSSSSSSD